MLTDAPPRKRNGAEFLESDRITTLDLPRDGSLLTITKSIESAMKAGKSTDVRRTCAEFLETASEFYKSLLAISEGLQPDRCESAKTGEQSFSATTLPKPC
jgi:hypothetical protein